MKLFIDTWGWLTLRDKKEERHEEVNLFYRNFRMQGGAIYTTDYFFLLFLLIKLFFLKEKFGYVLDETFTLLFLRLPFPHAKASMEFLDEAIRQEYLLLVWVAPERFSKAEQLRLRYQDKPRISFTDLTTMVVMDVASSFWETYHFRNQVCCGVVHCS